MKKKNVIKDCIAVSMFVWLAVIANDLKNWFLYSEVWGIWQYVNVGFFVLFIIVIKNHFRKTKI